MRLPMLKLEKIYMVRVIYKSGKTQDFEVKSLTVTPDKIEWESVNDCRPVKIGFDEIAAVWQVGIRRRIAR